MAPLNKPQIQVSLPPKPNLNRGSGGWPLNVDHVENWAWRNDIFTDSELDTIVRIGNQGNLEKATVYGPSQDNNVRNSFVDFLFPNETTEWIFARLAGAISQINSQFFQFDLTGLNQGLQFTRYMAPGEHYDWHVDRAYLHPSRKLSITIQLNDPSEYKGGELQLKFGHEEATMKKEKGMALFFPSYTLHRVKPVTKGTRYSLVAWVEGPPFK
jgi:PKHD-type hydroxylase